MKIRARILRVIIVCSLLKVPFVYGGRGNVEKDPNFIGRAGHPSYLSGSGGIKGFANIDSIRGLSTPNGHMSIHLRGAVSPVGNDLDGDRQLQADNVSSTSFECDAFCNKPRNNCGNKCNAQIASCEARGIKCHPWLCKAFCKDERSSTYCQNRRISTSDCNRHRQKCGCREYRTIGRYNAVTGLAAVYDSSADEIIVTWDKVKGPKHYNIFVSQDGKKLEKVSARGRKKGLTASPTFEPGRSYEIAVRRKRTKTMEASPYTMIQYKHIVAVDAVHQHRAYNDVASTTEDYTGDVTGDVLLNDADPDFGHTLAVDLHQVAGPAGSRVTYSGDGLSMIITLANGSTLSLSTNGDFIFHRAPGAYQELSGTQEDYEEFKYVVGDNHGNTAEATLYVRIQGASDAPIALNDLFIHSSGDPTTIEDVADGCVLENDKDIDIGDVANLAVCVVDGVEIQNDVHQHVDLGQHTKLSIGADGCFTISGLAAEYQNLRKGDTADMCFFYQACDGFGYKSNVAEACVRVEGVYHGQDYCLSNNGGCDPLTECINSPEGPTCGPCPPEYSGTGESGCAQNNLCNFFHVSTENDANYTTLFLQGWTDAQVSWAISLASKATKFEFNLPAKDGTEISSLEASAGILESAIADVNDILTLPDIRVTPGSSCSRDDATLKLAIPSSVKSICFSDDCRPTLCRLPPLPSVLPHYTFVPGNNNILFGDSRNCTVVRPSLWDEWVAFHFGEGNEYTSVDFYYADPDGDGVINILEYYGLGKTDLFVDAPNETIAEDELETVCFEEQNEIIFFGVEEAISYEEGVVRLNWMPPNLTKSTMDLVGVSYEILVSKGVFDFANLNNTLSTCLSTISELRAAFPLREAGSLLAMFRETTTETSLTLEELQPSEEYSILVVASSQSFSSLNRYETRVSVSAANPVLRSNVEHAGEVSASQELSIVQDKQGGWISFTNDLGHNFPGSLQKILTSDLQAKSWFLSGIDSKDNLYQVRVLSISEQSSFRANLTVVEAFIDDIFESLQVEYSLDDILSKGRPSPESSTSRSLGLVPGSLFHESVANKIEVEVPIIDDMWTIKTILENRLTISVSSVLEDKKLRRLRATAKHVFSYTTESSFTLGGKIQIKPKEGVQIWPPSGVDKGGQIKFTIGAVPVWINFTPKLLLEFGVTTTSGIQHTTKDAITRERSIQVTYDADRAEPWSLRSFSSSPSVSDDQNKPELVSEPIEVASQLTFSANIDLFFRLSIDMYKVAEFYPIGVDLDLGLGAALKASFSAADSFIEKSYPFYISEFDPSIYVFARGTGKLLGGVGSDDGPGLEKELVRITVLEIKLFKDLPEVSYVAGSCYWSRCDALLKIKASVRSSGSGIFDHKLVGPYEWVFETNTPWELETGYPDALLRYPDACKEGTNLIAPSGNMYFVASTGIPVCRGCFHDYDRLVYDYPIQCPSIGVGFPVEGTDPTLKEIAPKSPATTISVDSTIPCVAVIDEDTEFVTRNQGIDQETMWDRFREEYPNRLFCLLDIPSTDGKIVNVPEKFKSDPHTKYIDNISRDYGVEEKANDWFELCDLSEYSSIGYVAEFVDNSGSLKIEQVKASLQLFHDRLDALGIGHITVIDTNENWIKPFLTTLQGPPCKTLHGSQDGQCILTEKCAVLDNNGSPHQSVPWLTGDPTPNCRVYADDIQCCVPNPEPCVTRDGHNGICVHVDDCAGVSVPWLEEDPYPNCARYPSDVQCCV